MIMERVSILVQHLVRKSTTRSKQNTVAIASRGARGLLGDRSGLAMMIRFRVATSRSHQEQTLVILTSV